MGGQVDVLAAQALREPASLEAVHHGTLHLRQVQLDAGAGERRAELVEGLDRRAVDLVDAARDQDESPCVGVGLDQSREAGLEAACVGEVEALVDADEERLRARLDRVPLDVAEVLAPAGRRPSTAMWGRLVRAEVGDQRRGCRHTHEDAVHRCPRVEAPRDEGGQEAQRVAAVVACQTRQVADELHEGPRGRATATTMIAASTALRQRARRALRQEQTTVESR